MSKQALSLSSLILFMGVLRNLILATSKKKKKKKGKRPSPKIKRIFSPNSSEDQNQKKASSSQFGTICLLD